MEAEVMNDAQRMEAWHLATQVAALQEKGMSELFAETRSETRARMAADMQLADDFTAHRASTEQRCAGLTSQVEVLQAELQVERHRVAELMEALARESREREGLMRQAAEHNAAMWDALKKELLEALRAEANLQTTARQELEERHAATAKSTAYAIHSLQERAAATETLDDKLEARLKAAEGLLASNDTTVTKLVHSTKALEELSDKMDAKLKEQTHDIQRNEMEIRTNTLRLEKGMEAEANDRQRLSERLSEQAAQMATDKEAARVSTAGVMGRLADCAAQLQECVAHRQLIVALRGDVDDNTKTCDENTKSCEAMEAAVKEVKMMTRRDRMGDISGLERLKAMEMAMEQRRLELTDSANVVRRLNRMEEEIRFVSNAQQKLRNSLKESSFTTGREQGV